MITKQYADFFNGLEKNNHKEWFHSHKKDYDLHVKKAFISLLEQIIPKLTKLEPEISPFAKDAIFRINRDIRFAKDKTPYNVLMKAGFSPGGKKSFLPGYYLGISASKIHVGGGLFNLKGPELKKIRYLIADEVSAFTSIVDSSDFTSTFGELRGEQAKRIDKALQPVIEKTPYILNKQFYAMADLSLKPHLNSEHLPKVILDHFKRIEPLNNFLNRAFS